jgi:hypothetical protein
MNYLAHFVSDYRPAHPCFNIGLMLPDLLRSSSPAWRLERRLPSNPPPRVADFYAGIDQHLRRDRHFHGLSLFRRQASWLRIRLSLEAHLPDRYLFFLAHIWFELALDRYIVRHYPQWVERLYQDWASPSWVRWGRFLLSLQAQSPRDDARLLRRFGEEQFLWHYLQNQRLRGILEAVSRRVGLSFFGELSQTEFDHLAGEVDERLAALLRDRTVLAELSLESLR